MTDRSTEARPGQKGPAGSSEDTAVRPPLTERIQQRVSRAAQEHQANKENKAAAKPAVAPVMRLRREIFMAKPIFDDISRVARQFYI